MLDWPGKVRKPKGKCVLRNTVEDNDLFTIKGFTPQSTEDSRSSQVVEGFSCF